MKYMITVREILSRDLIVEAENAQEAEDKVTEAYDSEDIILDYHDFQFVSYITDNDCLTEEQCEGIDKLTDYIREI